MNEEIERLRRLANRVHVAIHDIAQAEEFAQTFKSLRSQPSIGSLAVHLDQLEAAIGMAAIVSYGRPFVASRSNGVADKFLKPSDLKLFDGHPHHEAEHELVMLLRDQVVAHSDWTHRFSMVGVPDEFSEHQRHLVVFDTRLLLTNFHSFIDLTRHVQTHLIPLIMSLDRQIAQTEASSRSAE